MPNFCAASDCNNRIRGHHFPKERDLKKKWIVAIKRVANKHDKAWHPSENAVVCYKHFLPSDYVNSTLTGTCILKIFFYLHIF